LTGLQRKTKYLEITSRQKLTRKATKVPKLRALKLNHHSEEQQTT